MASDYTGPRHRAVTDREKNRRRYAELLKGGMTPTHVVEQRDVRRQGATFRLGASIMGRHMYSGGAGPWRFFVDTVIPLSKSNRCSLISSSVPL